jgi:5'-phosphate synthase pdxT subunit
VGVLALQGDFREHREMLEGMGHCVVEVRKPAQLNDLDALIIPGGESTTIARLILSNGFQEPLRDFAASGRAMWGTCAGAILLARAVDNLDRPGIEVMDITVRRNAFGRQTESFEADLDVTGLQGGPFRAVFIRAPLIEEVRLPARAIATLADGTIVAAREANMLATSFHPELTGDTRLHQLFLSIGATAERVRRNPPGVLESFVDARGRLKSWPVKRRPQEGALAYLSSQLEADRDYSENEINALLDSLHAFGDCALLRRALVDGRYLERTSNGAKYTVAKREPGPADV